jgi:hypothetical protein
MSRAVVAGPDHGIGAALADRGATVTRVEAPVTADRLHEAGVEAADVFVLTDASEATAIPLVKEASDARCVVYDSRSVPEFARGQLDLAVDPDLLSPGTVADEL